MSDFDTPESTEPQSVNDVSLDSYIEDAPETTPEETPAFEAETPESSVETPVVEAEADPFQDFGGRDTVEAAMRLYETAATEEGIIQIWIEAGRSLGFTPDQMQRILDDSPGATAPDQPEFDPDEPMTRGEWLEYQRQQQEAAQRAAQDYQAQQQLAISSQALHATVQELGLDLADPTTKQILALGDQYMDKRGLPTPEGVREAVRRGYADYQALTQKAQQQYVQTKKQHANVPGAPSGASAPSSPAPAEPQNTAEAIKMFRERFGS